LSKSLNDKKINFPPRFVLICLGCKVNQAEAAMLTTSFIQHGWELANLKEEIQVLILLTCTITATAGRQSRKILNRLIKKYPKARIIASGCDVQASTTAYFKKKIEIVSRSDLVNLVSLVMTKKLIPQKTHFPPPNSGPFCPGQRLIGKNYTRGLLKIQDGCNANCAYCIIPTVRGQSRSLPLNDTINAWKKISQAGTSEIVLTGIHLGHWGIDLTPPTNLANLVSILLATHSITRLRFSSLEINEVNDNLITLMTTETRICQHLHIPLQTASNQLLKSMGRAYTNFQYAACIKTITKFLHRIQIGTDVIVGLPGETETDFQNTKKFIIKLPLSYLHIFPYSPRPNTLAATMSDLVSSHIIRQRTLILRNISKKKQLIFYQAQLGQCLNAIVENNGLTRTDNYCLAHLNSSQSTNDSIKIKVLDIKNSDITGPILKASVIK